MALVAVCFVIAHKIGQLHKAVSSVEVIGVDDRERVVDGTCGFKHRVTGAPRLGAVGRDGNALRNVLCLLENILDLYAAFDALADSLAEKLKVFLFYNENDLVKARLERIIDRVVDDELAVGADRVNLLEPAVSAAHTCCKNKQCHYLSPTVSDYLI